MTSRQILDSSKLKEFVDDNFKFDENGRKLSKREENTVGKREIARYEQFFLFPHCFQKACFTGASKGVIVWEWVNFQGHLYKSNIFETLKLTFCSKMNINTFKTEHQVENGIVSSSDRMLLKV